MKQEVYSWRLSTELKAELEREARARKTSISNLLEAVVQDWFRQSRGCLDDREQQALLHTEAEKCLGAFSGGNPRRAETARQTIRKSLARRYGR
jgi:hypothetical protein